MAPRTRRGRGVTARCRRSTNRSWRLFRTLRPTTFVGLRRPSRGSPRCYRQFARYDSTFRLVQCHNCHRCTRSLADTLLGSGNTTKAAVRRYPCSTGVARPRRMGTLPRSCNACAINFERLPHDSYTSRTHAPPVRPFRCRPRGPSPHPSPIRRRRRSFPNRRFELAAASSPDSSILQSTSVPAAPPLLWDGISGVSKDFFNYGAQLPWQNVGGDWSDAAQVPQGTSAYATITFPARVRRRRRSRRWFSAGTQTATPALISSAPPMPVMSRRAPIATRRYVRSWRSP